MATTLTLFLQADINGAVTIFEGRLSTWLKAHPVQADLCHGMVSLQTLTKTAIEQIRGQPEGETKKRTFTSTSTNGLGLSKANHPGKMDFSTLQAFPSTGNFPPSVGLGVPGSDIFDQVSQGGRAVTPSGVGALNGNGKSGFYLTFRKVITFFVVRSTTGRSFQPGFNWFGGWRSRCYGIAPVLGGIMYVYHLQYTGCASFIHGMPFLQLVYR